MTALSILKKLGTLTSRTPLLVRSVLVYGVLGAVIALVVSLSHQSTPNTISVVPYVAPKTTEATGNTASAVQYVKEGTPTRIVVKRLNIDLPIEPGKYDAKTGEWTLSDSAAYFATITDEPNDYKGNTFLYGHNRRSVFGPLSGLKAGDTVDIYTQNNIIFTYTYTGDDSVNPDMTNILYEHPDYPRLVLMTCEGLTSATRRVMYFTLTSVYSTTQGDNS